jgi:hypothetical protein
MKKRQIVLSITGNGNPVQKEIEIVKGVTTKDLKRDGLVPGSFQVIRKTNGEQLADGVDLFDTLEEGELLLATPPSTVGSLAGKIARFFSFRRKITVLHSYEIPAAREPTKIACMHSREHGSKPARALPKVSVKPPELIGPDAELTALGFARDGKIFQGLVKDKHGVNYPVQIEKNFIGNRLYIRNPPPHVLFGQHNLCFRCVGDGWYWVHFNGDSGYAPGLVRSLLAIINDSPGA